MKSRVATILLDVKSTDLVAGAGRTMQDKTGCENNMHALQTACEHVLKGTSSYSISYTKWLQEKHGKEAARMRMGICTARSYGLPDHTVFGHTNRKVGHGGRKLVFMSDLHAKPFRSCKITTCRRARM